MKLHKVKNFLSFPTKSTNKEQNFETPQNQKRLKTKRTLKSQFLLTEYLYFPGTFLYFQLIDGEWILS